MTVAHTKTTCPRDCYDRCGLIATVEDGRVIAVRGDRANTHTRGAMCKKCATAWNGVWLDTAQRLSTPMQRRGRKGSAEYVPIDWDAALDLIADRLHDAATRFGSSTILHAHYQGTYSALACHFPSRFFHRLGATEVDPSSICDGAGHVALEAIYGTSFVGFDPRTAPDEDTPCDLGSQPVAQCAGHRPQLGSRFHRNCHRRRPVEHQHR
jgi:anaerobic selenocysteine-containing dehydrogenase